MREVNSGQSLECLVWCEFDGLMRERMGGKWGADWESGRGTGRQRRRPCAYALDPGRAARAIQDQLSSGAFGTEYSYTHRLAVHGWVGFSKQSLELIFALTVQEPYDLVHKFRRDSCASLVV